MTVYTFDGSAVPLKVGGEPFVIVGRNDVGMPLVQSPDGALYILAPGCAPRFVSSSVLQFVDACRAYTEAAAGWRSDTDTAAAVKVFEQIRRIDPRAVTEDGAFWMSIREEMEHGVL